MTIRASGAGRKKNVVQLPKKRSVSIPPPQELLSDIAKEMWRKQAKVLTERGSFEPAHYPMLVLYCNAWHYMIMADQCVTAKAEAHPNSNGLTSEGGSGGEKTNPTFTARNVAFNQIIRAGSLLGLDPLSSMRFSASSKGDAYGEFDKF
ncbi:P27 family phage terminase small subunit [Pantoea sp. SOD02]|uniref:P27 family phage terminase small subunit n=1 Tax=Pantoea sp. SOD02 TaxID=2970818 RepID=UPI00215848CC|nr:P27 family phage terminase small subunit [Pantoea sp. SOD02]UVC29315.1 P27 family phage terminase small subunit [Pantoea sp. SOD02]